MTPNYRPFYLFAVIVLITVIGFGYFVGTLTSCKDAAIGALECHKMYLAFGVLFGIAALLVVGAGLYTLLPHSGQGTPAGKEVFDGMIKVLPPIATLVLGYYFGSQQSAQRTPEAAPPAVAAKASAAAPSASAAGPAASRPGR